MSPERINKELGRHWSCLFWLEGIPSSSTLLSRRPFPSCPGVIFARWLSSAAWWPHNPRISWCNPSAKSGGEQSRALFLPFSSERCWCGRGATLCLKYAAAGTDWQWLRCTGNGEREIGNPDMKWGASLSASVKRRLCPSGTTRVGATHATTDCQGTLVFPPIFMLWAQ